ncbi:hypothetical protein PENTCL1PPCAC_21387 [Pristionchus entomophagus]|uniref:Partial AB-hydrolase lipase domain-containing protein n=1 Tax=Pristionchus entomophagus TaxID=358040 RepID=A0AAV5TYN7_9BILA|nr:hypothetical protein PENTCL1PPCAC_21387 [Pristionchus entomophagus]
MFFVLFVFSVIFQSTEAVADPEMFMEPIDMIRYWGYPAELHDVLTADGYILDLFRIPHGRHSEANASCFPDASCHRPVVLMDHGLSASSAEFIVNPPESSAAYILADAGFDVFLLNHRGSTHGKRHVSIAPWSNKFWHFTYVVCIMLF